MKNRTITSSGSSLKKDTLFYGAATLAERFVAFLILPLLTKTLAQEYYGIWTQMIVTAGLLSGIVLVGFHTAAVRFLAGEKDDQETSSIFHVMLSIVLLNSFLFIILAFLFASSLSKIMFGDARFYRFIPLFGFFLAAEVLFELTTAFLRARKEIRLLSLYYFLKNTFRVGILAIGILLFHIDLFQAIIFIVISQLLLIAFIYVKDVLKKIGLSISAWNIRWREIMFFSLPLIPYGILIWANNFVDRYFIVHILNINQVSIYAVAFSLSAIVGLFYSILGFTLYPHMAKLWNDGDKIGAAETLRKATEYYLFFAVPLIAILTILSTPLIRILSTAEYLSSWQIVFWLSTGIFIFGLYQLNNYATLLANKTFLIFKISAVALFSNVILNMILIPSIGILGAAIATFLSNSILAFWTIIIGEKYLSYTLPWRTTTKIVLSALIMSSILLIARYYLDTNNPFVLVFTITLAIAIYGSIDLLNKNSVLLQLRKNL